MSLRADNLAFAYHAARPVLRGISLEFRPGTVTALVGPNGAGKSTLLRLLAGVLAPGSGHVRLDGAAIGSMTHNARASRLAYVAQRPSLAFSFTVRRYVALGGFAAGNPDPEPALRAVDLLDRADEPFDTLSAGQQQRASLARAKTQLSGPAAGARCLLLDEPISAMDPRHALQTMVLLREQARAGLVVVLALHDLSLAARFCDAAAVLDASGAVVSAGPASQVLVPAVLDPVFAVRFDREPSLVPRLP
jgi:iron complex transport system ATP-binding protein